MINVVADRYLYNIAAYLPKSVNLSLYDPANGLPNLNQVNALLIRTVNPINPETLPDIPDSLSFIGTGSSGTDHVDVQYLKANDITFADSAGCNARSVAEYETVGLLLWSEAAGKSLQNLSVGIVGVGHTGRQVQQQLVKLGISTIGYDPPRAERESTFHSASVDEVLNADILTFHTPLTTGGRHPTHHWLDEEKLSSCNFQLVINAARGGVVNEQALLEACQDKTIGHFILDVWENEPDLESKIAEKAFLKTPHIAGYSIQAKQNASKFIADALLNHFELANNTTFIQPNTEIITKPIKQYNSLTELLAELHPIRKYQRQLKKIIIRHWNERGQRFNKLRSEFPLRQEFGHIQLQESYFNRFPILEKLGFEIFD